VTVTNIINTPIPEIAAYHCKWQRNRDVLSGEDEVKAKRSTYLPYASSEQTDAEYLIHLANVPFYPAASRTLDGYIGLMFRKRVILAATPLVEDLLQVVTNDGKDLDDLAELVAREVLSVNYGGLLVDHPAATPGLSLAAARNAGQRPWVAFYPAESVLGPEFGAVNNRKTLLRVRLQDDDTTVRELLLEDGVYTVQMHHAVDGEWIAGERVVPLVRGKPLNAIPFVLLSHNQADLPSPAVMADTVMLNLQHYRANGLLSLAHRFIASPIPYICGADDDSNSEAQELSVVPGVLWKFTNHETKVAFLEINGDGIPALERLRDHLEHQMSIVGLNMLAAEKNAVEAAETHKLRMASENSVLAGISRVIARKIKEVLDLMAMWADGSTVEFGINTDFIPGEVTAEQLREVRELFAAGLLSKETVFHILRDGEIVDATLTFEAEQARIATDGPPAQVVE